MAQLRDSRTSELIIDGTPLEVALVARELGEREVLFDDVGGAFDPAAVIAKHEEHVDALETIAHADPDADLAGAALEAARQEADVAALVGPAAAALEQARARVGD